VLEVVAMDCCGTAEAGVTTLAGEAGGAEAGEAVAAAEEDIVESERDRMIVGVSLLRGTTAGHDARDDEKKGSL
jgi:hypothetical protein